MRIILVASIASCILFYGTVSAQDYNPYKSIGKKATVLTLSKGKYFEFFDNDTVQRIGTVLINIRTQKVVKLLKNLEINKNRSDNSSASRWYSIDPMAEKFREWSPYNFALNNPVRYNDADGQAPNDIVTFNSQGQEISRVKSNTEFVTLVRWEYTSKITGEKMSITAEAPMPGVAAGYEDPKYQKNDYQIAASTFLFNYDLAGAKNPAVLNKQDLPTTENHSIGTDLPQQLDVNLVKAMTLTETQGGTVKGASGTGLTDVMQVNNKGDWAAEKSSVGLSKGETMTPQSSINAGIKWLFLKGMSSNAQGVMNWRNGQNGDWSSAVSSYNGGGDPKYSQKVQDKLNSMTPAQPSNY